MTLVAGNHDRCHPYNGARGERFVDVYLERCKLSDLVLTNTTLVLNSGIEAKVSHFPYADPQLDGKEAWVEQFDHPTNVVSLNCDGAPTGNLVVVTLPDRVSGGEPAIEWLAVLANKRRGEFPDDGVAPEGSDDRVDCLRRRWCAQQRKVCALEGVGASGPTRRLAVRLNARGGSHADVQPARSRLRPPLAHNPVIRTIQAFTSATAASRDNPMPPDAAART